MLIWILTRIDYRSEPVLILSCKYADFAHQNSDVFSLLNDTKPYIELHVVSMVDY